MAFEIFEADNCRRKGTGPRITISKNGAIYMNTATLRDFLPDAQYAVLMFDSETNRIAIKAVEKNSEHAYRISQKPKSAGCHMSGLKFLEHYKITHEKTISYPAKWVDDINAVVIELEGGETSSKGG